MPSESITHNFVINNADSVERFIEVLDKPKMKKSNLNVVHINDVDEAMLLVERWKNDR